MWFKRQIGRTSLPAEQLLLFYLGVFGWGFAITTLPGPVALVIIFVTIVIVLLQG